MKEVDRKRLPWRRALKRYILFQVPGYATLLLLLIILRQWMDLPGWVTFVSFAVWMVKDIILFPFVWRSYMPSPAGDDRLLGEIGVARERLNPSGYISVRGELWKARLVKEHGKEPVEEGRLVEIVGIQGLMLFVRPKKN